MGDESDARSVNSSTASEKLQERLAEHGARLEEHRLRLASHKEILSGDASPRSAHSPTINLMSRRLNRSGSVEDILQHLGKTYAEKLEQRKMEVYAKESAEIRPPSINRVSANLVREVAVQDRLMEISREREQKLKKARDEAAKTTDPDATFKPEINLASRRLNRTGSVDQLCNNWAEEVKRKTEKERQDQQKEKEAQFKSPSLSKRSEKLAARLRAGHKARVEDALLERDHVLKQIRQRMSEIEFQQQTPLSPQITEKAASMVRDGDVSERLYQLSRERQQRLDAIREEKARQALASARPQTAPSPDRGVRVEHELLRRGMEAEEKRERMRQKIEEQERTQHSPRINPYSLELEQRQPLTASERLLSTPTPRYSPTPEDGPEYTFKPHINPHSKKLVEGRARSGQDLINSLMAIPKAKEKKREAEQRKREEEEEKKCTFRPDVKRANRFPSVRARSNVPIVDRLLQWGEKRREELKHQKTRQEMAAEAELTFHPTFDPPPEIPRLPSDGRQPYGIDTFLERQAKAREARKLASTVPHVTGENWTPGPTKPQEFRFHSRAATTVNSTQAIQSPRQRSGSISTTASVTPQPLAFDEFAATLRAAWEDTSGPDTTNPASSTAPTPTPAPAPAPTPSVAGTPRSPPYTSRSEPPAILSQIRIPDTTSSGPSTEWLRRAKEKRELEEAESQRGGDPELFVDGDFIMVDDGRERPWRETPLSSDSPRPMQSDRALNAFMERMAKGRALKQERDPTRPGVFADGSNWTPQLTVPKAPKLNTSRSHHK